MSWFSLLKIFPPPTNAAFLFPVLMDKTEYDARMEKLQEGKTSPKEIAQIKGVFTSLNKPIESYYEQYSPYGDATLEEFTERFNNMKKLVMGQKSPLKNIPQEEAIKELDAIISLIREEKNEEAQQKFTDLKTKMPAFKKQDNYWAGNQRLQRRYLYVVNIFGSKSRITFENPPNDEKILQNFAEMLGGEYSEGFILTDLATEGELNKKIKENNEIREFYLENFAAKKNRPSAKMKFIPKEGKTEEISDDMFVFEVKYERVGEFTEEEVFKFIKALNSQAITGKIGAFLPQKLPNGVKVPKSMEVSTTGNRVQLNPYISYILNNNFNENWFDLFFKDIRVNQVLDRNTALNFIIEEIASTLLGNKDKTPETNVDVSEYRRNETIAGIIARNDKERLKSQLRRFIDKRNDLKADANDGAMKLQRNQFKMLGDAFTREEYKKIPKIIEDKNKSNLKYIEKVIYYDFEGTEVGEENYTDDLEDKKLPKGVVYIKIIALDEKYDDVILTPANINDYLKEDVSVGIEGFGSGLFIPKDFYSFVKQLNATKPLKNVFRNINTINFAEQFNPENFILVISKLAERALNDTEPREVFKSLPDNEQSDEADARLQALSKRMPKLLNDIKDKVIETFKENLEDLAENYSTRIKNKSDVQKVKPLFDRLIKDELIDFKKEESEEGQ